MERNSLDIINQETQQVRNDRTKYLIDALHTEIAGLRARVASLEESCRRYQAAEDKAEALTMRLQEIADDDKEPTQALIDLMRLPSSQTQEPDMDADALIFVFGSNLAGRHGKGAAKWALENRGAVYGIGEGMTGQSYALPTKDENLRTLSLRRIGEYVGQFLDFAEQHPWDQFQVTPIGCGLAGYTPEDIAPLFRKVTDNVHLPDEFRKVLGCQDEHRPIATPTSTTETSVVSSVVPE